MRICLGAVRTTSVETLHVEAQEPPLQIRHAYQSDAYVVKLKEKCEERSLGKLKRLANLHLMHIYWDKKTSSLLTFAFRETAKCKTNLYRPKLFNLEYFDTFDKPIVPFPKYIKELHHDIQLYLPLTSLFDCIIHTDG